ncbi:CD209 antigen-like protein C isoform X1 [Seriola aureovittata]|uniref:CD209 antigen-like protein C isoform X1 n=1 Tax=Seriola aureovittata TaxID=2871759 RepID=UPI0024BEE4D3|nr:CD209 antigen-like protein C isoform X1 [Seriola aureovittata]
MSLNIYEEPSLIMDVRYSKGIREDRGERVERLVDIYDGQNTSTEHHIYLSTQDRGAHTQKPPPAVQRNPFRAAALILGLLCILLLGGCIVLSKLYMQIIEEKNIVDATNNELQVRLDTILKETCQAQGNKTVAGWKRFRCSCYYKSTDMKNWNDSREDCQSIGADLVIINSKEEQEFVMKMNEHGASWIGLQSEKIKVWPEKWQWKWVDGSLPEYRAWQVGVDVIPVDRSTAYMDVQGWMRAKNGSKQWICEKQI